MAKSYRIGLDIKIIYLVLLMLNDWVFILGFNYQVPQRW